jgi:hypothetical protein
MISFLPNKILFKLRAFDGKKVIIEAGIIFFRGCVMSLSSGHS